MKIISWNVNGLKAAMRKSLAKYISYSGADIFCIQEVRSEADFDVEGYQQFWNLAKEGGYAGTLTLTKVPPLSVNSELGKDDLTDEGRMLSLEYEHFYAVNVYLPNTWYKPERLAYRMRWEEAFHNYLDSLGKPVIICGDFNVAYGEGDYYPGSARAKQEAEGLQTWEKENMTELLAKGYVDAFRFLYPTKTGSYTCWSNRDGLRTQDHGARIDYFLVDRSLAGRISDVRHASGKMGSDHCPVSMDINLPLTGKGASFGEVRGEDDEAAALTWDSADWESMEEELLDLQAKISKAAYVKDWERVKRLQIQTVRSSPAKMLAVRHTAALDSQPGIDGVRWNTSAEKMRAAESLTSKDYHALPCKTVLLDTGKKIRELHLPVMRDRAMQKLYSFSLDPVAEATADRKSFAFRKGRSMMDVHTYLCRMLKQPGVAYVIKADVESCYDSISHRWLLDHIPMDKKVLREFLRSGTVGGGELFPTNRGISQGASLSPILGNMVLDGMQKFIYERRGRKETEGFADGDMIRYADDVVITVRTKAAAYGIIKSLQEFLAERGLRLNEEKTTIIDVEEGFDFLSRFYRIDGKTGTLIVMPSDSAVNGFLKRLESTVSAFEGSQKSLIDRLNRMLSGWGNYHRITDAEAAFKSVDTKLTALLMTKLRDIHPKLSQKKIIEKYWYRADVGEYYFALEQDRTVRVMHLAGLPIVRHQAAATSYNPYCDTAYMEQLKARREIQKQGNSRLRAVWLRQGGLCYFCGRKMQPLQLVKLVERELGKGYKTANLAYIHAACEDMELETEETAPDYSRRLAEAVFPYDAYKEGYDRLREYFRVQARSPFTLRFKEAEEVMGLPLPEEARSDENFWYDKETDDARPPISLCWRSQGFRLFHLHLDREEAVFCRSEHRKEGLVVPDKLIKQRIPVEAVYEAEQFFAYLIKRYAL